MTFMSECPWCGREPGAHADACPFAEPATWWQFWRNGPEADLIFVAVAVVVVELLILLCVAMS